jgi:hypothetical protein
MSLKMR